MDSTPYSPPQYALTSVFGWEPMDYGWYGRIQSIKVEWICQNTSISMYTDNRSPCKVWLITNISIPGLNRGTVNYGGCGLTEQSLPRVKMHSASVSLHLESGIDAMAQSAQT